MEWSDAVDEAAWIAPRLADFDSFRVDSVVPGGFAAYARDRARELAMAVAGLVSG